MQNLQNSASPPRLLGLIGDVHCENAYLRLATETLLQENVETIVCTGDLPTGVGDINACCRLLKSHHIATVRGNHDRWLLNLETMSLPFATNPNELTTQSWKFLQSLPVIHEIATPLGLAQLCHGIGQDDMAVVLPDQSDWEIRNNPFLKPIVASGRYRFMINGHSHRRLVRQFGTMTLVNAGTLRRDHDPCFALIDFESKQVRFWDILDQETAVPAGELPLC